MSNRTFFILSALGFLVYFFLFSVRLEKELVLRPELVLEENTSIAPQPDGFSWQMGDNFGFIDDHNHFSKFRAGYAAVSGDSLVVVQNEPGFYSLISSSGETISQFESEGIPLLRGGRLFLLSVKEGYIAEYSLAGTRLWNYQFIYPISSLDANAEILVLGDLGGQCHILDVNGDVEQIYVPSGSRLSCIYGISISEASDRIVLISGKAPQRFLLLEKRISGYQPVKHFNLAHSFSRTCFLDFTHDDSRVVLEGKNELIIFHVEDSSLVKLPIDGSLYDYYFDSETRIQSFLVRNGDYDFELFLYTSGERLLYQRGFQAEDAFVRIFNSKVYVGQDGKVLCAGIDQL